MLSFSGHKLHAPKGIGVLYIKPGTPCRPLLIGGHQEAGRRAGTENMPYIVGLARALELAEQHFEDEETRVRGLRDRLERSIEATIPNVQVNGRGATRLPNTLNVSCHFVEGEGMLYQLSDAGICASSGSACTSGSLEPSHVLRAMKVPFTAVHGSVRFSLSRYNTDADIDHILEVFPGVVANLRRLSPYWDQQQNAPRADAEELVRANPRSVRGKKSEIRNTKSETNSNPEMRMTQNGGLRQAALFWSLHVWILNLFGFRVRILRFPVRHLLSSLPRCSWTAAHCTHTAV